MLVQASGVVLSEHANLLDLRVGHIAEREDNAPVAARDRHRSDGSFSGKLLHSVIIAAGQNNSYRSHFSSPALMIDLPLGRIPSG